MTNPPPFPKKRQRPIAAHDKGPRKRPGPEAQPAPVTATKAAAEDSVKSLAKLVRAASSAVKPIKVVRDGWPVTAYINFGEFQYEAAIRCGSTRKLGRFIKEEAPDALRFPDWLRSDCKWLYAALNISDHPHADILSVLGVSRIEDFKSSHPSVIRQEYRRAAKRAEIPA